MRSLLTLLFVTLLSAPWAMAQTMVSGTVSDEAGPLHFAVVTVKGTTIGVATDETGKYAISVPDGYDRLVVKFVGYTSQEVEIGGRSTIDFTLEEDLMELDEVVVTGYLTTKRKDLTGAVSSVSADDIATMPAPTVQNVLQGRTAGVMVTSNSGTPGGGMDVRVRGSTSISASNQPLYVIDGVPVIRGNQSQNGVGNALTNPLSDINPNDIQNIEVLKDAASTAIYGARGANGVVLITTKKGKAGAPKVTLNSTIGFQEAWNRVEMLDGDQYMEYIGTVLGNPEALGPQTGNVNWQDEIFQRGVITDNNLSISGGDTKSNYYASLSYYGNEGIVVGSAFNRISGRLNLENNASDIFKFGMNVGYTHSEADRVQNDNNIYGVVSTAILLPSNFAIFNDDGSYQTKYGLENPINGAVNYHNLAVSNRVTGNAFGKLDIIDGLFLRGSLGMDVLGFREEIYEPNTLQSAAGTNGRGFVGQSTTQSWISDLTLNYQKTFDLHAVSAVVGTSYQDFTRERVSADVTDFPTPDFTTLNAGANVVEASADFTRWGIESYFANAAYNYNETYFFTGVVRLDRSSRFLGDNRNGFFPGASAAWRISNMDFMSSVSQVNDLKLRVGYGVTGNQDGIGAFEAQQLWGGGANYFGSSGIAPSQLGNPDLRWETTTQFNTGLDVTVLNNRLSANIDFFIKNTNDLLLDRPIPTTSGFTTVIANIGSMRNIGYELSLNSVNVNSDLRWETTLTVARVQNEITELFDDQPLDFGFGSRVAVGQPIGTFYGYVTDGIFQSQEEIDAAATQTSGTAPGDVRFKDLNDDGVINDEDRDFIGSAQPDLMGGLTNTLSYKGLELSIFFQFSVGNEIYNNNAVFAEGMNSVFNQTTRTLDAWTPENTDTDMPRAVWGDPNANRRDSDRFVEDGSYLRLKNASLGYTLPADVVSKLGLARVKIFAAGQNLLTFTNYSWFDPEVNTFDGSNAALGTDFLTYPQARTVTLGANISF
ncbi:TonB-dependent receptor [Pontibacter sp. G13]|uniref:SusC/RagA family TonB-linked outer membrane protein n=1 Tax=Pontibacter sp. G13 TaxID=3074898 RepID=UPI0028890CF6|nr:TonB-dependent receptor [Pontibacter sp. G13]WNJ20168.1 TonB-dependent receptor [Pontibacter sp. G13]